jgi:periplasmic protein TonB
MFEDSLLESGGRDSKLHRRGPWATVISFIIQAALVGVLVLIPLFFTDTLPKQQLMGYLVAPPPPPPPPPPPAAAPVIRAVVKPTTEIDNGQLKAPTKIPEKIAIIKEEAPPPPSAGVVGGVVGGVPGGQAGGVVGGVLGSIVTAAPVAVPKVEVPAPPQKPYKLSSGVTAGMLIQQVRPTYPPLAKQARISGSVVLQAVIGKDGSIQQLKAVSGHPMLIPSALEAVRQWKYKPYFLNGEPVEVDTQVTVNFTLSGG